LGTAVVCVKGSCEILHSVRVFLDSGSQITAIANCCVSLLGFVKQKCNTEIVDIAQNPIAKVKGVTFCRFLPHFTTEHTFNFSDVLVLLLITDYTSTLQLPSCIQKSYEHILLADLNFDVPTQIDMLLGGDIFP